MNRIDLCKQNYTSLFGGEALNGKGTDPEMMDILQKYIFGEIFRTGDLDMKTRELITCVTLAAMQQLPQLKAHSAAALNVGVSPIQLREAIYQCASIIGFPKTLNALGALNSTFEERGIKLPLESQATATEDSRNKIGQKMQQSSYDYSNAIKDALKGLPDGMNEEAARYFTEVNFGDFQSRSGLELKTRKLLSFCAITSLGVDELLPLSLESNLKAGNSIETVTAAAIQCMPYIGFPLAIKALKAISDNAGL